MDPPPYTHRAPITIPPGYTYRVGRLFDQAKLTCLIDSPHFNISLIRRQAIPNDALIIKTGPKQFVPGFDYGPGPESATLPCTLSEFCIAPLRVGSGGILCKLWVVEDAWAEVFLAKSIVGPRGLGPGKNLPVFTSGGGPLEVREFDNKGFVWDNA